MRDAEVAGPDRLDLFGAVHLEQLDVGSGSDLDHRLGTNDRSWERADRPLEVGSLPHPPW
jgi:hypothetical protein